MHFVIDFRWQPVPYYVQNDLTGVRIVAGRETTYPSRMKILRATFSTPQ